MSADETRKQDQAQKAASPAADAPATPAPTPETPTEATTATVTAEAEAVRGHELPTLEDGLPGGSMRNINMLLDVTVPVVVELGSTQLVVKDILQLGPGSIIELDKMAGEPVDVMVRGKLLAQGEVVVVDESFGVRLTRIVSADERMESLRDA